MKLDAHSPDDSILLKQISLFCAYCLSQDAMRPTYTGESEKNVGRLADVACSHPIVMILLNCIKAAMFSWWGRVWMRGFVLVLCCVCSGVSASAVRGLMWRGFLFSPGSAEGRSKTSLFV